MLLASLKRFTQKQTSTNGLLIGFALFWMSHASSTWGAQNVTLAWDANIETNVAGYKVYYGVGSRAYTNAINAGNVTNQTVPGLIEGTTYYFAATAYDISSIESDYSDEVTYTVPLTVQNRAPTLNALSNLTINEDAGSQTVNLAGISSGASNEIQTLAVSAVSSNPGLIPNPTVSYTSPSATGNLTFTPVANANGNSIITVTVNDGQATSNTVTRTFTVTVNAVNDPPTLNALSNLTINENSSSQSVNLSGISSGAANESQTLAVSAVSSNPGLIPNPTVIYTSPNATGNLTFTPVANANGNSIITVTVNDGQLTSNTVVRTFTVTVAAVNNPPTLNALSNLTINEDDASQSVNLSGIGSGAANESQTLAVSAVSSNPGLIPNPTVSYTSPSATGNLTFTPVANANGNSIITVTVNDGQAISNTAVRTFTVTVNAVNDAPTLNSLSNLTLNEDAGPQSVSLAGIGSGAANESQPLAVSAVSSNPGLIPNPTVSYTSPNASGSLAFTPVANASGSATVTVTVNDGQATSNTVVRTFTVTVNAVNDPPTLNALSNLTINENSSSQSVNLSGISSGAANESQALAVSAVSSNPGLIPNPTVNYTSPNASGSLAFTPAANAGGSATITVTVNDGQATSNTVARSFTVSVNRLPTISGITNRITAEGTATPPISFVIGDTETSAPSLTLSGLSSNPTLVPNTNIVFGGIDANRTVTITPTQGNIGSANITVTVSDASGGTASTTFQLNVQTKPAPPGNLKLTLN